MHTLHIRIYYQYVYVFKHMHIREYLCIEDENKIFHVFCS